MVEQRPIRCRSMRCPRFSPGRASSEDRAVAPPLCLYAFGGTTAGIRGGSGAVLSPTGPDMAHRAPRAAEIESLNIAPLPRDFDSIGRAPYGRPIEPKSRGRGAPHAAHWGSQYAAPWTRPDSRLTFSRLGRSCNLTTKPMSSFCHCVRVCRFEHPSTWSATRSGPMNPGKRRERETPAPLAT